MSGPVVKINEGHGPYGVIRREHSTDDELILDREFDELSGVVLVADTRPPDPALEMALSSRPSGLDVVVVREDPTSFTEALAAALPVELPTKPKFGSPKNDSRHSDLRAKRKAERQARKKNRRNR